MKNFFKQFFKDKFATASLVVLLLLYISIFLANFIAVYPKKYSNRNLSYAPPSNIYFITPEGKPTSPYTYTYIRKFDKDSPSMYFIPDRTQKY